jgi:hypothetical protein
MGEAIDNGAKAQKAGALSLGQCQATTSSLKTVCVFIYWPIHAISDPKTSENLMVTGTWPEPSRHVPHVFL